MPIKKENLRRLASLSALGAGALGAGVDTADASSIIWSGLLNETVGYQPGAATRFTFAGPNGAGARMTLRSFYGCSAICTKHLSVYLGENRGAHGTKFQFLLTGFPVGATFSSKRRLYPPGAVLAASFCSGSLGHPCSPTRTFTNFGFTAADPYMLFRFTGGNPKQAMFGWAQFSLSFPGNLSGPDVTLVDWAYETSGAKLPAGDTGTPEPSTLALTGLAALALGAKGLRRWRGARKAA